MLSIMTKEPTNNNEISSHHSQSKASKPGWFQADLWFHWVAAENGGFNMCCLYSHVMLSMTKVLTHNIEVFSHHSQSKANQAGFKQTCGVTAWWLMNVAAVHTTSVVYIHTLLDTKLISNRGAA